MEEKKLHLLKVRLRIAAKVLSAVVLSAGAFYLAFALGTACENQPSAYEFAGSESADSATAITLPMPPFAGNPPLSAFKTE